MYLNSGNVVAFAGAKNYEGCVIKSAGCRSHAWIVFMYIRCRFNKSDFGNLFIRPDFEGPGGFQSDTRSQTSRISSWRKFAHNSLGQRVTAAGVPLPEAFYFPACYRSVGQWAWGPAFADSAVNNSCILNATSSPYIFGTCNPAAPGKDGDVPETSSNSFFTPDGALKIKCGSDLLTLADAQSVGYEIGSTVATTQSVDAVVDLIHRWLGF